MGAKKVTWQYDAEFTEKCKKAIEQIYGCKIPLPKQAAKNTSYVSKRSLRALRGKRGDYAGDVALFTEE